MAGEQDVTMADETGVYYARRGRYRVQNSLVYPGQWIVSHAATGGVVAYHRSDAAAVADAESRWANDRGKGWQRNQ